MKCTIFAVLSNGAELNCMLESLGTQYQLSHFYFFFYLYFSYDFIINVLALLLSKTINKKQRTSQFSDELVGRVKERLVGSDGSQKSVTFLRQHRHLSLLLHVFQHTQSLINCIQSVMFLRQQSHKHKSLLRSLDSI